MIFTPAQIRAIRLGKMTAVLVPVSERMRAGSVRVLRRRMVDGPPAKRGPAGDVLAYIEARLDLLEAVQVVVNPQPEGEPIPALITIKAVRDLPVEELTAVEAVRCGAWTVAGLRASWAAEHPRSYLVRLVVFELGDTRDGHLLIAAGWPDYTYDPSRAMFGEPEPVSRGEQARLASDAQQRYLRLQADKARDAARSALSERLEAIQAPRRP
jgi:hypothetical protein